MCAAFFLALALPVLSSFVLEPSAFALAWTSAVRPSSFVLRPSTFVLAAAQAKAPPPLTAPVNDFARVIDPESAQELDRRIRALQQASGDVVAVATVKTFKPYADINEFAREMFENGGRGIGEKGKDNGALVVVAVDDRQVRIETGYDLEEFITDGFAGETIRQFIVPEFRSGAYGRGLLAGTTRLINRVAERRGVTLQDVPVERPRVEAPSRIPGWVFVMLAWFVIMLISNRRDHRRRRRRWGRGPWSGWSSGVGPFGGGTFGGGFGGFGGRSGGGVGGFGGFGGGRSGGGGASGGW
jgi:uncharacterized protein